MAESKSPKSGNAADKVVSELKVAYEMELETVCNYLANSIHLDGLLAQEVRESLKTDIPEELGHATKIAERLKILNSNVPGSLALNFSQKSLQPPKDTTDIVAVIRGVIEAEKGAIAQYEKLIKLSEEAADHVTHDMVVNLMADEQHHLREFEGFLRAWERHKP